MNNQQYMVLGIKDFPVKDTETEKDNPYIFSSLERALVVARETAESNFKNDGVFYSSVVRLETLQEFNQPMIDAERIAAGHSLE